MYRNPSHRLSEDLPKSGLKQIFLALDYPHTECQLVHTGEYVFFSFTRHIFYF